MQHERNPHSRHFIALADLKRRGGSYTQAIELLYVGLKRYPDCLSAHWLLGLCLLATGEYDKAHTQLQQVLDRDPDHALVGEALARCELRDSMLPESQADKLFPAPYVVTDEPLQEEVRITRVDEIAPEVPEAVPADEVAPEAVESVPADAPAPHTSESANADEAGPDPAESASASAVDTAQADVVLDTPDTPGTSAAEPATQDKAGSPPAEAIPSMFVTRTLADIYLAQGHQDKALRILYQVLAAHPEREDIVSRITALEEGAGTPEARESAPGSETPDGDAEDLNRSRFDAWVDEQDTEG